MSRPARHLTWVAILALGWAGGWIGGALAQDADLLARAESGDTQAQAELARRYHEGDGVVQSYAEAAPWFERAARAGDMQAANTLGRYYHTGLGTAHDPEAALHWLGLAAEAGDPTHQTDYAKALENGADDSQNPEAAAQWYARAAEQGHLEAITSLGVLYQTGQGVAQDYEQAIGLFTIAADRGDARAQNNLGLLYVRGQGVTQDYDRAAELFTAATEQGLRTAMANLGVMYENGFGVPVDEARAAELYRRSGQSDSLTAAEPGTSGITYDPRLVPLEPGAQLSDDLEKSARAGDPVAAFQLGWLLATHPQAGHAEFARAAQAWHRAAEAGYGPGMANLGLLYFRGQGVPQDYVLGYMWLSRAAAIGTPGTAAQRDILSQNHNMTAAQINEAQDRAIHP